MKDEPIAGLRIASREEFVYWDESKYPRRAVYKRFERLQYRSAGGEWEDVPKVSLGRIEIDAAPTS